MDYLRIEVNECSYKEHCKQLLMKFIDGINDKTITTEIPKELPTIRKLVALPLNRCSARKKIVGVQKASRGMLKNIQENKEFGMISCIKPHAGRMITHRLNWAAQYMWQEDAHPQDAGRTTTSMRSARSPTEEHPRESQGKEEISNEIQQENDTWGREFDLVRTKVSMFTASDQC